MNEPAGFSRRTMLRGVGAMMALPLMESLVPREARAAAASAGPPLRMGIFTVTGGTVLESWKMPQAGPLTKLPSILRPLEFAKDDLLLISGLSNAGRTENLNGHEACAFTHLTGAELAKREGGKIKSSISVDQAAAAAVGEQTFLPSLEIGLNNHETQYSFRSADSPVPYENNPRLVFERMFRGRKPVAPNWRRRASEPAAAGASQTGDSDERSVIDLVLGQANDLRRKMGRVDRQKLDEYLESVHSVEKRLAFIESRHRQEVLDLASPGASQIRLPENLPGEDVPVYKITQPIERDPERHGDYIRLMAEMMVLAFQTDTTRVVTLAAGSDGASFPGVVTVGYERHCHTLEHQGNAGRVEDADPIAREALRQIHAWYTLFFAEMVQKMKNIDEGGSSLLDNSMIVYTSYMADGGHGRNDYPVVLAGRGGGTIKTGRQINFEKRAPMSNLWVEMLHRMGSPVEKFGDSETSKFAGDFRSRLPLA